MNTNSVSQTGPGSRKKPESAIDGYAGCCILQPDEIVDEGRILFSEYYGREVSAEEAQEIFKNVADIAQELFNVSRSKEGENG